MTDHTKTFLIHPVRGYPQDEFLSVVQSLRAEGFEVYWPARDTNQDDATGYRICAQNFHAMKGCEYVHVLWDGKSEGVLFDLGMAFALGKQVVVVELPEPTKGKSFPNMVREWAHFSRIEQWHLGDLEKP